ncbi:MULTISPECIES: hypothetical protein [Streptomyces]|uniref:Uncharacterized protein n=1 Tax=Streptomyces kaempferi TaxID=333725 RepID=A0ABW3XDF9_9ACTN|nr:hypothetical protein [Streptomyces sp. NBC_01462]
MIPPISQAVPQRIAAADGTAAVRNFGMAEKTGGVLGMLDRQVKGDMK